MNWSNFIKNSEESLASEHSGIDTVKNLRILKEEFDQNLTKFFNLIENKKEMDVARLSDTLATTFDHLRLPKFIEKVKSGERIFQLEDAETNDNSEEEVKIEIEPRATNFQGDKLKSDRKPLKIIHFNDVYNIEESKHEPVSGYARFYSALRTYDHVNPLILFSGDIFAPSKLSIFFEGKHMMPFVKKAGIH